MNTDLKAPRAGLRLADEAWIAAALLHRENPERLDFSVREIVDRAKSEGLSIPFRSGVETHVRYHGVADRDPRKVSLRMFTETSGGRRRLYREGDATHPLRRGKKVLPEPDAIPERYRYLLDWYRNEYALARRDEWLQGVFDMIGSAKEAFRGIDPDRYVRQLREGWE
jgi:hypothetical protein